jgi:hypothetical protein
MLVARVFRRRRFAPSRECPHLKIEIWGTRFCGVNLDVGHPPRVSVPVGGSEEIEVVRMVKALVV